MLKVGKLYHCEQCHLMLYPDQETAAEDELGGYIEELHVEVDAAYWSEQFGKPVSYTEKNIPLLVLDSKEKFYEVLIEDKKGWIIFKDWLEIREIV